MRFVPTSLIVLACTFLLSNGVYAKEQTVRTISVVHRSASSIAKDIEAVLDDSVGLHVDGQRIILRGEPKRVAELARLIKVLDRKVAQFAITVLQTSAPIPLDSHQNLLQIKEYTTDNSADDHTVQQIRVQENKVATFASGEVSYIVKPSGIGLHQVQLDFERHFADDHTQQTLASTIVVPIGRWTEISRERNSLETGQPIRAYRTEKSQARHSHIFVKVETVQ